MDNRVLIFSAVICSLLSCVNEEVIPDLSSKTDIPKFEGVLQDSFNNQSIVLYGNSSRGIMVAYRSVLPNGASESLKRSALPFPNVFESFDNTIWNVFGEAVSGPKEGMQLSSINSQVGYWFSFSAFFPMVTINEEPDQERIKDTFSSTDWLLNPELIVSGALKDGIPALSSPNYIQLTSANCLNNYYVGDEELVTLIEDNGTFKVFPHKILDYHEIVNDYVNGIPFVLSYCPLTGTSDAWLRTINGIEYNFGVSGLLYNNNLILYDRETDSLWPQILKHSINGDLINTQTSSLKVIEITWAGAKQISCDLLLLSDATGFSRNYSKYPYGNYKLTDALLFPLTFEDHRLDFKNRVLNVQITDESKVYQFKNFEPK